MWKLNNVRIYVEKDSGWYCTPRKGTVELLDTNSSILHTAGRPSFRRDITFVFFGDIDTNILPMIAANTVSLEDDAGSVTTVSIMDFKSERLYDFKLRKIYRCNISLLQVD